MMSPDSFNSRYVPIAYMALSGPDLNMTERIGSGSGYWQNLKTYLLAMALAQPTIWPDPSRISVPGFVYGDVRFAAAAPLGRAKAWNSVCW